MDAAGHSPHFLRDSSVFEWKNFSLLSDLKYMLAIALCLAVGLYLGYPAAGMIAAAGAMTVRLVLIGWRFQHRRV